MLYRLFQYLNEHTDLPGMRIGEYISFRSAAAIILSLLITILFGKRIIRFLRRKQIGEEIRDLGLEGQLQKRGTPTMGGIIILMAIVIPVLLFGNLENVYIQLMLISTLWLGFIGGLDDYIKVFRKNKEGMSEKGKLVFEYHRNMHRNAQEKVQKLIDTLSPESLAAVQGIIGALDEMLDEM